MEYFTYRSPFGKIQLNVFNGRLEKAEPGRFEPQDPSSLPEGGADVENVFTRFLDSYFCGRPVTISLERFNMEPVTPFQRKLYRVLMETGFGETVSYGDVAGMVGRPKGARAAGRAAAANPFPIFIPCHRVVMGNGEPGGFIAGGKWKRSLLEHEKSARGRFF